MKLNKRLYNTIVVLLPLILYFALFVIITKNLYTIFSTFQLIIFAKTYILWGIIFVSYFGILSLHKKIKYFIFLLPTLVISITISLTIRYNGTDGMILIWWFLLPLMLASIVYPIGAVLYDRLYKETENLTL